MFNLEVDADHCYRVGEQGILVHNNSIDDCQFLGLFFLTQHGVVNGVKYFDTEPIPGSTEMRATGVQARVDKSKLRTGEKAEYYPPGWIKGLNTPGDTKIARGHLLPRVLGGAGSDKNPNSPKNIIPICHRTTNVKEMEHKVELKIKAILENASIGVVDYEVHVTYGDAAHPAVPTLITIRAQAYDCEMSKCEVFNLPIMNPADLTTCP